MRLMGSVQPSRQGKRHHSSATQTPTRHVVVEGSREFCLATVARLGKVQIVELRSKNKEALCY